MVDDQPDPTCVCGGLGTSRGCGAVMTKATRHLCRSPVSGFGFVNPGYVETFELEVLCDACMAKLPADWKETFLG